MQKVNVRYVAKEDYSSPKGAFACSFQGLSEALGRDPASTDLLKRHPFDVEITHVPPGKRNFPFHSHAAQWEFYYVTAGRGVVRHDGGSTAIEGGDAFVFKPGEAHQIINDGDVDLVYLVVADNPIGESCHYPDSGKWVVRSPERRLIRSESLDYYDGEE